MGSFTYENQGAYTYLVYRLTDEEMIDSMGLGMITNNTIPGLADTLFMQMNSAKYIKYNISSRIPASQFFSGAVSRKRLLGVFEGIINALLSAEEYMIQMDSILLDLDYIFADVSTCDTVLICLPVTNQKQEHVDPGIFFKNIMFSTQFDQTENCDHVTRIINYLNSAYAFSPADFKKLIKELQDQIQVKPLISPLPPSVAPHSSGGHSDQTGKLLIEPQTSQMVSGPPSTTSVVTSATDLQTPEAEPEKSTDNTEGHEKGMSLFYLLRHYDKENASIYKAQKEDRKQQKAVREPKKKKEKKKKEKPDRPASRFAIPGQVPSIPLDRPEPPIPSAPVMPVPSVSGIQQSEKVQVPHMQESSSVKVSPQPVFEGGAEDPGMDFGNTVFMGSADDQEDATVMMGMGMHTQGQQMCPYLVRRRNNERIPIQKDVFRLGRNQDFNDYVVLGNEFVGNSHCHILIRDKDCFIVDDNSKNHTFVNGVMVQPGSEVPLTHGQTVTLADEEFEFRLC